MILVVGATGTLGGKVVRGLLDRGELVRILVRPGSPSEEMAKQGMATSPRALFEIGAEIIEGDLTERSSLDAAVAGVDTVITTATSTKRTAGTPAELEPVDLHGTLNLIDAASQAGVRHFIYTSVYGAAPDHPFPLFAFKGQCEEALKSSGMTYTILHPGIFMEVWIGVVVGIPLQAGQPITLVGQGDHRHNFVSEDDVAAYIVAAVNNPAAENQAIQAAGPEALSWTEVVDRVGQAMGTSLPRQYVAPGSTVPLIPAAMSEIFNAMETFETHLDSEEMSARYGVDLTDLDSYASQTFAMPTE